MSRLSHRNITTEAMIFTFYLLFFVVVFFFFFKIYFNKTPAGPLPAPPQQERFMFSACFIVYVLWMWFGHRNESFKKSLEEIKEQHKIATMQRHGWDEMWRGFWRKSISSVKQKFHFSFQPPQASKDSECSGFSKVELNFRDVQMNSPNIISRINDTFFLSFFVFDTQSKTTANLRSKTSTTTTLLVFGFVFDCWFGLVWFFR